MIKHFNATFPLRVQSYASAPYIDLSKQPAGAVRYNSNNQGIEVYDGMTWLPLGSTVSVELEEAADEALKWAMRKCAEEKQIEELTLQYPALAEAKQVYETVLNLVKNHQQQK